MKTKIFVCSNSEIENISHPASITSIPIHLILGEREEYDDEVDITQNEFFNRYQLDTRVKPSYSFIKYDNIIKMMNTAIKNGYEQFLFILSTREYGDTFIAISLAMSEFKEYQSYVYLSNTLNYPLAKMAIEADKMFKEDKEYDEIEHMLDNISRNNKLVFYQNNVLKDYDVQANDNNDIYKLEDGKLTKINKNKNEILAQMLENLDYTNGDEVFIMYSMPRASIIKELEDEITYKLDIKKVKKYPVAPIVGILLGKYVVGVGIIKNNG